MILFFSQFTYNAIHFTGGKTWFILFYFFPTKLLTIHDCYKIRFWDDRVRTNSKTRLYFYRLFYYSIPIFFANKVSAPSVFTVNELKTLFPKLVEDKIVYLPNFLPFDYSPSCVKIDVIRNSVLMFGSAPNKNIVTTLYSIRNLNVDLVIYKIGYFTGYELSILERAELNYIELGFLNDNELNHIFSKVDIFLFLSYYEGFGLPIIEAQRLRKLIITSNLMPCIDVLGTGNYSVNPFDSIEICKVLENVLSSDLDGLSLILEKNVENSRSYLLDELIARYLEFYSND